MSTNTPHRTTALDERVNTAVIENRAASVAHLFRRSRQPEP